MLAFASGPTPRVLSSNGSPTSVSDAGDERFGEPAGIASSTITVGGGTALPGIVVARGDGGGRGGGDVLPPTR